MPAAEVLQRAAIAGQKLESAKYTLHGTVISTTGNQKFSISGTANGILQAKGQDSQHHLAVIASANQAGQDMTATIEGDVAVNWGKQLYFTFQKLELMPASPTSPAVTSMLVGKWWNLPLGGAAPTAPSITADPGMLQLQASVVKVVKEYPVESAGGEDVYRYDVVLDGDLLKKYLKTTAESRREVFDAAQADDFVKNFRAEGSVRILASSFFPKDVQWHIVSVSAPGTGERAHLDATVSVSLSNYNAAPTITFPAQSEPFSPALLLGLAGMLPAMPDVGGTSPHLP